MDSEAPEIEPMMGFSQTRDVLLEGVLWSALHRPREKAELRLAMEAELARVLPGKDYALLVEVDGGRFFVEIARGESCPLTPGEEGPPGIWQPEGKTTFPLLYDHYQIGELVLRGQPDEDTAKLLEILLLHFSIALANHRLNEETQKNVTVYSQSLRSLEEGIGLLQVQDRESLAARFLQLALLAVGSHAGAVYSLEELGKLDSGLKFQHAMGLPEHLLEEIVLEDGTWWPGAVADTSCPLLLSRDPITGEFPGLDNNRIPPPFKTLMVAPLSYHGFHTGICIFCNIDFEDPAFVEKKEASSHLLELGAALFHRAQLEQDAIHARQMETELEIASVVQRQLIPKAPPQIPHLEIGFLSKMSQHVGGDYLDILEGDLGETFCVLADVSGHGINSALLMSSFRSTYRGDSMWVQPDELLASLNERVREEAQGTGMFLTAVTLKIENNGSSFEFASAGHNPVFVYRPSEDKFYDLEASGPPLGMFPGIEYEEEVFSTRPEDLLILYTDGIVEASNHQGEMFEVERLQECIRKNKDQPVPDIVQNLYGQVVQFTDRKEQEDDISLLILRFKENQ
jgi:sigma-B regulation protein RsbU (phosphoserine phosphatase)